jgi:hypothetical protein
MAKMPPQIAWPSLPNSELITTGGINGLMLTIVSGLSEPYEAKCIALQ